MKIGIVGSGMVGSTAAYAMLMSAVGREIILVDKNSKRAEAEAFDLTHAVPFAYPLNIKSGSYADLEGCKIVIIAAGVSQKPGETRLDLLKRNALVFKEVTGRILDNAPEAILVIATNPLDIMTSLADYYASQKGIKPGRVFGTGTMLDTARFRTLLAQYTGVDSKHIHGYVLGEHGDSEVLTWSLVTVGVMKLDDFCEFKNISMGEKEKTDIDNRVRNAAYEIIEGKGATYYGIGSAIAKIVDVVLHDQRSVLTVSVPVTSDTGSLRVSTSMPYIVGGEGIISALPLKLSEQEANWFKQSKKTTAAAMEGLESFL